MTTNLSAITEDAISAAAAMADLDAACLHLQTIAGITDGGGAGIYFSGPAGDDWAEHPAWLREFHLCEWINLERNFLDQGETS